MLSIILLVVCLAATWVALFVVHPSMMQKLSLYGLHDVRDELYVFSNRYPKALDTLIYRDLEFLLTLAIHVVRERPWTESVGFATILDTVVDSWRKECYEQEMGTIYAAADIRRALEERVRSIYVARALVAMHVVAGRLRPGP